MWNSIPGAWARTGPASKTAKDRPASRFLDFIFHARREGAYSAHVGTGAYSAQVGTGAYSAHVGTGALTKPALSQSKGPAAQVYRAAVPFLLPTLSS